MPREIIHEPENRRFAMDVEGQIASLVYRERGGGVYDFVSTYVPPDLRGRGIGGRIVLHALEHARAEGWRVVPSCWFVREAIDREPGYASVLAS